LIIGYKKQKPLLEGAEFVLQRAIAKADVVLTVSNTSREDILERFPSARGKLEVLYNRLSEEWLRPVPEVNLGDIGIAKEFLLYVGNFKKHKGIDVLLDAYRTLKDPPQLVLVGNRGGMETELSERIFDTPNVRLLGLAEGALLRRLYAEATVFVFPSFYEGFGYPPLEAMISGAPVLSSDAPALREILGGAAEFFTRGNVEDLADRLQRLLGDSKKRQSLREFGIRHAKEFVSEKSPDQLLRIYQRLEP